MNFLQAIFLTVAVSGPIATLIGIALAVVSVIRSCKAKSAKLALVSGLCALTVLALLSAIIVVWFAYGVAHTGKDATTDLVVLASTVASAYIGAFAAWKLFAYVKKRLVPRVS